MAISNVGNEIIKWFMPTKLSVKEVKWTPIDKFDIFLKISFQGIQTLRAFELKAKQKSYEPPKWLD